MWEIGILLGLSLFLWKFVGIWEWDIPKKWELKLIYWLKKIRGDSQTETYTFPICPSEEISLACLQKSFTEIEMDIGIKDKSEIKC